MNDAAQILLSQKLCVFALNILLSVGAGVVLVTISYFVVTNNCFSPHVWMKVT